MNQPKLEMPKDPASELYFDANRLVVSFRKRRGQPVPKSAVRALRIVIQCFGWVIEDRFFKAGSVITVGGEKGNTFRIPTRGLAERHPLIEYTTSGTIRLLLNEHFTGFLQTGDKLQEIKNQTKSIELPSGSRGALEHGTLTIYFEEIPDPEKIPPVPIFKQMTDPYFYRWLVISIIFHLLILIIMKLLPAKPTEVTLEELSPKFQKLIIEPSKFEKYVPALAMSAQGLSRGKVGQEGEGARAAGTEGRRGRGVPGSGRRVATNDISNRGILDVFNRGKKGVLSDLLGGSAIPGEAESAMNRNARYGLQGERDLREGKGFQGGGTGGGGASTSIGQGLGTKGKGGGAKGSGLADFGTGKGDTAVSASIDQEEVYIMGNIPKEVIARIINDHLGQIRWCYEKELQAHPNLRGKIVTDFVIGLGGNVTATKIKQSTMGSPPVEQCVQDVLKRIQFPKPGGGIVQVIYPFLFRVAG